jgi:amino acid transporter
MGISAMICYSRSMWGMAEMGWAPKILTKQMSSGAPHMSVALHALVGFALIWFDFGFIVQVEYTVAATSYILTDFSFLRLRFKEPDAERPYKAPGGLPFAFLIVFFKVAVMGSNMVAGLVQDWRICVATGAVNVAVLLAYVIYVRLNPVQHAIPIDETAPVLARKSLNPAEDSFEARGSTSRESVKPVSV